MRTRFEFTFHTVGSDGDVDPSLAMLGAQGWEIRSSAPVAGGVMIALQRPLDEETPLPDASTLSASLAEPLAAPTAAELVE